MLPDDAESHGLEVLTGLAKRCPGRETLLHRVLAGHLAELLENVIRVAIHTGDPLGRIFAQRLGHEGTADLCERILILLQDPSNSQSVPLQEVALTASEKLLASYRAAWPEPDRNQRARLAPLCQRLSSYLLAAGRLAEAHTAAERASKLFLDLSQEEPATYLAGYASSLLNVAAARRELGQVQAAILAAREVVALSEQLPGNRRRMLAAGLQILGGALFDLGYSREAEEHNARSVRLFRELAEDDEYFQRALATGLGCEAVLLWELGRGTEARAVAQETADTVGYLASVRPDVNLLEHARALAFLGLLDRELGNYDEAVHDYTQAAGVLQQLSEERPESFRYDLAMILSTQALLLREIGRPEDALGLTDEAIANLRELVAVAPERFVPDLAAALMNQSNVLLVLGHLERASCAGEEALALLRLHAEKRAGEPSADLARALLNRARQWIELGARHEAVTCCKEAADLFRRLVISGSEPFRHELAAALTELAHSYEALDMRDEAFNVKRELAALTLKSAD